MKQIKLALAALVLSFTAANAQNGVDLSGSVDAYFRQDLLGTAQAPATSFVDGTGFNLGMVNLAASYDLEKAGFVGDVAFGPRAQDAGINDYINQLYAYWNATDKLTLTLGKANTFLGYEVISPKGNFNNSTSYLFTNGPFNNTGLKANYQFSDDFSAMLGVFNSTDFAGSNNEGAYTVGAQLGFVGQYLNFIYGDYDGAALDGATGQTFTADFTGGASLTESLYLGLNAAYKTTGTNVDDADAPLYYGAALYLQNSFSDLFSLGLRGEYFAEDNYGFGALVTDAKGAGSVIATTLTGRLNIAEGLTVIPELRADFTSEDSFVDADGKATSVLPSFSLGVVYGF